jgi:hypothetical protein
VTAAQAARPANSSVASVLAGLENRLARSHGQAAAPRAGARRAAMKDAEAAMA